MREWGLYADAGAYGRFRVSEVADWSVGGAWCWIGRSFLFVPIERLVAR